MQSDPSVALSSARHCFCRRAVQESGVTHFHFQFQFSLAEWGHGHTVFGRVLPADLPAVDALVRRPRRNETWGQTHVQVLVTPIPFRLLIPA